MMDLRDLFSTPVSVPAEVSQKTQKKQANYATAILRKLPRPTTWTRLPKTSGSPVSNGHSRGSKGKNISTPTCAKTSGNGSSKKSSLTAGPVPYDGAKKFTTLEELSRNKIESNAHASKTKLQEDIASENELSVIGSQPRDGDEAEYDADNSELEDTHSVHSDTSVHSAKSSGTKSVCSARSGISGKQTKTRRKTIAHKNNNIVLVYENY